MSGGPNGVEVLEGVTRWAPLVADVWSKFVPADRLPQMVALTLAQMAHESKGQIGARNADSGATGLLQLLSTDLKARAVQLGGVNDPRAQVQVYAETVLGLARQGAGPDIAAWRWASGPGTVRASLAVRRPKGAGRVTDAVAAKQLNGYILPLLRHTFRRYASWTEQWMGLSSPIPRVWDGTFRWGGREWAIGDGDAVAGAWSSAGVSWGAVFAAGLVAVGVLMAALKRRAGL